MHAHFILAAQCSWSLIVFSCASREGSIRAQLSRSRCQPALCSGHISSPQSTESVGAHHSVVFDLWSRKPSLPSQHQEAAPPFFRSIQKNMARNSSRFSSADFYLAKLTSHQWWLACNAHYICNALATDMLICCCQAHNTDMLICCQAHPEPHQPKS